MRIATFTTRVHTSYNFAPSTVLTFSEFYGTLSHSTFDLSTATSFSSTSVFHFQASNHLNHLLHTDFASSPGCTLHHPTLTPAQSLPSAHPLTYLHDRMSFNPRQALPSAQSLQQRPYSLLVQPSTVFMASPKTPARSYNILHFRGILLFFFF